MAAAITEPTRGKINLTALSVASVTRQTAVASLKQSLNLQDCVGLVRELLEYMQDGILPSLRQC